MPLTEAQQKLKKQADALYATCHTRECKNPLECSQQAAGIYADLCDQLTGDDQFEILLCYIDVMTHLDDKKNVPLVTRLKSFIQAHPQPLKQKAKEYTQQKNSEKASPLYFYLYRYAEGDIRFIALLYFTQIMNKTGSTKMADKYFINIKNLIYRHFRTIRDAEANAQIKNLHVHYQETREVARLFELAYHYLSHENFSAAATCYLKISIHKNRQPTNVAHAGLALLHIANITTDKWLIESIMFILFSSDHFKFVREQLDRVAREPEHYRNNPQNLAFLAMLFNSTESLCFKQLTQSKQYEVYHRWFNTMKTLVLASPKNQKKILIQSAGFLLAYALNFDSIAAFYILLTYGVDPNTILPTDDKGTALMLAATGKRLIAAQLLLMYGADPTITDVHGHTPIHCAANNGRFLVLQLLLDKYPDLVHLRDRSNCTPLHRAVILSAKQRVQLIPDTQTDNAEAIVYHCAKLLIDHGAEVNIIASDNTTPLLWAALNGFENVVALLLEHDATKSLTVRDKSNGMNPLHYVAEAGYNDIVLQLLHASADPNYINKYTRSSRQHHHESQTALHIAISNGQDETAILLLEQGAKVRDDQKERIVNGACAIGCYRTLQWLETHQIVSIEEIKRLAQKALFAYPIKFGGHFTALHIAARDGDIPQLTALLDLIAPENKKDYLNQKTLVQQPAAAAFLAVVHQQFEAAELLLEHGATFDRQEQCYVLSDTVNKNHVDALHWLWEHQIIGKDLFAEYAADGYMPFHHAVMLDRVDIATFMLGKNPGLINLKTKNDFGATALHLICSMFTEEIVDVLLSIPDIDLDAKDKKGRTAVSLIGELIRNPNTTEDQKPILTRIQRKIINKCIQQIQEAADPLYFDELLSASDLMSTGYHI